MTALNVFITKLGIIEHYNTPKRFSSSKGARARLTNISKQVMVSNVGLIGSIIAIKRYLIAITGKNQIPPTKPS